MNLKLSAYLCTACIILGVGIGYKLFSKPEQPATVVKQEEKKSGTITKKTTIKPDGTKQIDEIEVYQSDVKHESKVLPSKKTTWAFIPKYSFESNRINYAASYSYNGLGVYISSDKQIGIVLSLSY